MSLHYLVMSEKQTTWNVLFIINYTSQCSAATWFRCGGTFDHYFITKFTAGSILKEFFLK